MLVEPKDHIKEDQDRDCIYAELATYNWALAIASEIINTHGNSTSNWKASLEKHYSQIKTSPPTRIQKRKISQKIFHAINLGLSIRNKYINNYFNCYDIVGTISDFYYALYNIFNATSMSWDIPENTSHGKNIKIFGSLRDKYPYPFNIHAILSPSYVQGDTLINLNDFIYHLPGVISTSNTSTSNINIPQGAFPLQSSVAQDIILGYLRGNVEYLIEDIKKPFVKKYQLKTGVRKKEHKRLINPQLSKIDVNFLRCLYRYRTKAHYRDFVYLTYKYTNFEGKQNNAMNIELYNALATIVEFSVCCSVINFNYKFGKQVTQKYLNDMTVKLKDTISQHDDYWNSLI